MRKSDAVGELDAPNLGTRKSDAVGKQDPINYRATSKPQAPAQTPNAMPTHPYPRE